MGVVPCEFVDGQNAASLGLTGKELCTIKGIETLTPGKLLDVEAVTVAPLSERQEGRSENAATSKKFQVKARVDSLVEVDYYRNGGILPYVVRAAMK